MIPDLELIEMQRDTSFRIYMHDYPHQVAKWHFHPEYELHLITASVGKFFVGDYIGSFGPGNLVLTGPDLPHSWISELPDDQPVIKRDLVLQFSKNFADSFLAAFAELTYVSPLLSEASRGILFSADTSAQAQPLLTELLQAERSQRVALFLRVLDALIADQHRQLLAGVNYQPDPAEYMSSTINQVLSYIGQNLASDLNESDVAELAGMNVSTFSRFFRKQMKISFVQYITQSRINHACNLIMHTDLSITDICFRSGFNNISNFNRHFLAFKQIPPSKFRAYHQRLANKTADG